MNGRRWTAVSAWFLIPALLCGAASTAASQGVGGERVDFDALVESMVRKTDPSADGYDTQPFRGNPRRVMIELRTHGKAAIPALKRGLVHYFPVIRRTCLEALVELAAGLPAIKPALKDPDPETRFEAARKFIDGRKKEGIDALVSCFRLTKNRHRWSLYHGVLGNVSGLRQQHDWEAVSAVKAAEVIEGWETWWKKARARFKFDSEDKVLLAKVFAEDLDELVEECDAEELARIEEEAGRGGDSKKLVVRLQEFLEKAENIDCEVLVRAARCFAHLEEFQKALDLCRRVTDERNREMGISFNIYYDMAHFTAGEAHLGLGKKADARESLRRALLLNPDNPRFKKALKETLAR